MKKRKIFNLFATLTVGSVIASSTIAFFNKDNLNIFKVSNNNQVNYTSTVDEDNYNVDSVSFIQDTVHEKTTTPYGFLKYDANKKTIFSISFFGNIGWKYSLATSNFTKRGQINDFSKVYMYYISDVDRIVVYGQGNNKSFLFQLNAKDGSEYYVNNANQDTNGSSVISGMDSFAIDNLDQISYVNNKIIVLLPSELTETNKSINTFKINLDSYVASPLNIDLNGFDFEVPAEQPSPSQPEGHMVTDNYTSLENDAAEDTKPHVTETSNNGKYKTKNIIGFIEDSDKNILILSAIKEKDNSKESGLLFVILDQSLKYKSNSYIKFLDNSVINSKEYDDIFSKSYYDFVVQYGNNNKVEKIFTILKEINALDSYAGNLVGILDLTPSSSDKMIEKEAKQGENQKSSTNDIFYDKDTKKTYVLVRDAQNNNEHYGFYNASDGSQKFVYPITMNDKTENTTKRNLAIKLIGNKIDLNTKSQNVPFIYSYNGFASNGEWNSKKVGSWKVSVGDSNALTVSQEENFYPTQISDYQNLKTKYSYYLPQDINQEIFDEYVYMHKINQNDKLFNSTITIDNNSLKANNQNGTLFGYINLNLTKWWDYNEKTKQKEQIKININLTGLANNAGLSFALVVNSNIDSTKYEQILELQKTVYPSKVTKDNILNSFIKKGENISLNAEDIEMKTVGQVVDQANNLFNVKIKKAITVITNDEDGTLKIDYNLEGKTSPSSLNKIGTATFTNFKQLNTWQQIKWNQGKLINLKKSKMIFQITKKDVIDCLDLSSSYKREENYWNWTPKTSNNNNKQTYIQNNLDGVLEGEISYNRDLGETPVTVNQEFTKLSITKDNQGAGFLKFVDVIGNTNEKTVVYNAEKATQVASLYSASEAQKKAYEIFDQSMTFFNSWTSVASLDLGIPTVEGNKLTYRLKFSDTKIATNFVASDGEKLVLDSDWISAINKTSQVLTFDRTFSFNFNQTTYEWNYNIPITDSQYEIGSIQTTNSSIINTNDLEHFKTLTPTIFTNIYKNNNGEYLSFQDRFDLLKVNKTLDPSSIDYFVIKDIQLVPNDEKGTVYVQYEINYPNISNTSLGGETVYPQITLTGFKTLNDQIHQYLIWIIIMAAIIVVMGSSFGGYVFWNKKRNQREKEKYNRAKKRISLYEAQTHVNDFNPLKRSKNIRNTLHSHTLKNAKIKQYENNMKTYKKRLKEIDEMEKSKK